jgi:cytochrome c oxidase subunit 2
MGELMERCTRHLQAGAALTALLALPNAQANWGAINLTQGVTPIANQVYDLHMIILWICIAIGVVVFGAMAYSIIYHRKSKNHQPATFHESTKLEILWTVIPFAILVAIAVPATSTLLYMSDTSTDAEVTIKVTGHQWRWQYDYIDDGFSFVSNLNSEHNDARQRGSNVRVRDIEHYLLDVDEPVIVPINRKVRFLLTASDVIHSWWVPELGQKMDTIPGFINEMWTEIREPGIYRGQCAELCGKDHAFMPIVVKAVSDAEYDAWKDMKIEQAMAAAASSDREWGLDELLAKGDAVYKTYCAACHGVNGEGGVGKAIAGSAIVLGDEIAHAELLLKGVAGTAMGSYAAILNDVDLAAVLTYQRKGFGNDASIIQPSEIKTIR